MADCARSGVQSYVLAGGRSLRMGQDKAFVQIGGEFLLERALRSVLQVSSDAAILSGPPAFERDALLSCYGRLVPDLQAGYEGPLGGLIAALQDCQSSVAVIVAVDQPGLSAKCMASLLDEVERGAGAACFAVDGMPEPLPLVVRSSLASAVGEVFASGERRLLPGVRAAVEQQGLCLSLLPYPADLPPEVLANLNTPGDLQKWDSPGLTSSPAPCASEERYG